MIPKRSLRVARYCLPLLFIGCAPDTAVDIDLEAEAQAIRDLDEALSNAAQSRDAEAYSNFFSEDVVQMPPDLPPRTGRNAIFESSSGLFGAGGDLRFETTEVTVATSGDMAFSRGKYFLTLEIPGGTVHDEGSYLEVWEKVAGEWKITTDIYNTDLPTADAEGGDSA